MDGLTVARIGGISAVDHGAVKEVKTSLATYPSDDNIWSAGAREKKSASFGFDWRFRSDLKPFEVIAAGLHSLRLGLHAL